MRNIIVIMGVSLVISSFAKTQKDLRLEVIVDSERALGQRLEAVQRQYLPVSPPSLDRLLQPAGSFPVDWKGFDPDVRKHFRGRIDGDGIVRYVVGLYEDYWTGEMVVLDNTGWELFRIQRSRSYDPYDYQRALFKLGKKEVLANEFTRAVFHPAKISTLVELVPTVFWEAHLQAEQERVAQETFSMPMMMAMSGSSKPTARMTQGTNGVTLEVSLPIGFGPYMEVFRRDDLISDSWSVANSWIPTFGNTTVVWNDFTEESKGFYHISNAFDSDQDGFSDLREVWIEETSSNTFDAVNIDGDSMHDWFELKMFGNLDEGDLDDFDGDGLLNDQEMIYVPGASPPIILISDPSLYDTDADGLNDFDEVNGSPPTNPWDPDTSAPALSVFPANGTIISP